MSKKSNIYAAEIGADLFAACPKAVLAAIAVSGLTAGGDVLEEARARVLDEWWALYVAGIVPQKPPLQRPQPDTE